MRLLRAKVSVCCINASGVVCSDLDVRGASCLACQRQFGVEENSRENGSSLMGDRKCLVELISGLNIVCLGSLPQDSSPRALCIRVPAAYGKPGV